MLSVLWYLPATFNTMRRYNICNVLMLLRDLLLPSQVPCWWKQKGSLHTPLVRIVSYPSRGYFHIHCPEDRESENNNCFPPLTKMSEGKTNKYKHTYMRTYYARKTLQFVNKHSKATINTDIWNFFFLQFTNLLTNFITPWSRVLLQKLIGSQLVKKFPTFYGTRRFTTAFTSSRHLSLSWTSSTQSMSPFPTSWRFSLVLSFQLVLGLPSGLFPSGFPTKTLYMPLLSPCTLHAPPISFFSIWSPEQYWVRSTDH